jgi:hypothetical protein
MLVALSIHLVILMESVFAEMAILVINVITVLLVFSNHQLVFAIRVVVLIELTAAVNILTIHSLNKNFAIVLQNIVETLVKTVLLTIIFLMMIPVSHATALSHSYAI